MQEPPIRRRPKLQTTVADETLRTLNQVAEDTRLPHVGIAIDYIVNDWAKLKQAALRAATQPEAA